MTKAIETFSEEAERVEKVRQETVREIGRLGSDATIVARVAQTQTNQRCADGR